MATRTERVRLVLDDQFSSGAARAAAQAALLDRSLDNVGDSADRAGVSTKRLGRDIDTSTNAFRKGGADIDVFSGRLKLMAQAGAALGPALIPLSGAAVPAVTGLAAGLGAAAGAAGVAALAFNGVGSALEALNEYQLNPTTEGLAELEAELGKLGPAGAQFVTFLDSVGGDLQQLQVAAREGMFPGMEQGITDLLTLLPQVSDIVSRIATEMGDLSAMAGQALSTDADWGEFFSYLQTDAAPTLDAFARSAGNVAASFANLMVAFAPLSRDFTRNMLEGSQALREWTANGENLEGFIDYVRSVGPQAADFLGSLVDAIVALTTALAPWGSTVLPILTAVLDVFTAIASSPIGPPLATAAIAMLAFNKAAAAGTAIMGGVGPAFAGARSSIGQMRNDLGTVATTWATAGAASERESKRATAAADRLKTSMASVGKGAGMLGAVGVAATGAAQGIGLQNTAMLGLAGTMAGPWGAAAGAGVGLLLDYQAAQASAEQQVLQFTDMLNQQTGALTENNLAWIEGQITSDQLLSLEQAGISVTEVTEAVSKGKDAWFQYYESLSTAQQEALLNTESDFFTGNLNNQLIEIANTADDSATRFNVLGDATANYAEESSAAAAAAAMQAAAMQAQRDAARTTAEQFVGLGKTLDDAKVSLGGWLAEMEKSARDLERFGQNAARAARKGLDQGLIASLNEAGPAGARRMAQLANATDAEIARANAAWRRGQAAIENYVNMRVPPKRITVDISSAVSNVAAVQRVIDSLRGKTVTVTTLQKTIYGAGKMASIAAAQGKADGGMIHGPGTGTSDDVPIWASNGEFMIRAAAVDKYGVGFFERLNAMAYADGGLIHHRGAARFAKGGQTKGAGTSSASARSLDRYADRLEQAGKRIERAMSRTEKAIDLNRQQLETWNQKRDQLKSQVTNSLQRDWLSGNAGGVWANDTKAGSAAFAQQQWKQQATDAKQLAATIANLRKNGAGDAFIAEILGSSDPLAAAKMFNQQSVGGMRQSQKLFLDATRATSSAANSTSSIYADEQRKNTLEIKGLRNDLARLDKQLDRNHKEAEATRKRESAAKATSKGARDRR